MADTTISRAGVHGVCLRGTGAARLERVLVEGCAVRGCYVYQQATLEMHEVEVRGTVGPEEPAVQAGDTARLSMVRCRIHSNAGIDRGVADEVRILADEGNEVGCGTTGGSGGNSGKDGGVGMA